MSIVNGVLRKQDAGRCRAYGRPVNMVGCSRVTYLSNSAGSVKYQEYLNGYNGIRIAYDNLTKAKCLSGTKYFMARRQSSAKARIPWTSGRAKLCRNRA